MRNHGLESRDSCVLFGYNSRLDTLQAVVANHLLLKLPNLTKKRINNAHMLDKMLSDIKQISLPIRSKEINEVFHLYCFQAKNRNELAEFLISNGIDAKKHYPIPMHLQKAATYLGYKKGDFPIAERLADSTISLQFMSLYRLNKLKKWVIWFGVFIMDKIKVPFVDLGRFYKNHRDKILELTDQVGNSGIYILGNIVEEFERDFATYCGVNHAISVGNGTDALALCLHALDIGPGDEVIIPANSFIATAGAVVEVGAIPICVDVDTEQNISIDAIEKQLLRKQRQLLLFI